MQSVSISGPYTPSESVLLHGQAFAGPKGFNDSFELLTGDEKVRASDLNRALLAAAFLANEAVGALRLRIGERKTLFGLRKVPALYVEPVGQPAPWPAPSIEARLREVVDAVKGQKEGNEVRQVVYALLREDSAKPWMTALDDTKRYLAARGRVDAEERTRLKIFTTVHHTLSEAQAADVARHPPEQAQRLLADYQARRPEEWKLLMKAIKDGVDMRVEASDDVGGD